MSRAQASGGESRTKLYVMVGVCVALVAVAAWQIYGYFGGGGGGTPQTPEVKAAQQHAEQIGNDPAAVKAAEDMQKAASTTQAQPAPSRGPQKMPQ